MATPIEPAADNLPLVVEAKSRKKAAGVNVIIKLERLMIHAKTSFGLIVTDKGITRKAWKELDRMVREHNQFRVGIISSDSIRNEILNSSMNIQETIAALFLKTRLHEIVGK